MKNILLLFPIFLFSLNGYSQEFTDVVYHRVINDIIMNTERYSLTHRHAFRKMLLEQAASGSDTAFKRLEKRDSLERLPHYLKGDFIEDEKLFEILEEYSHEFINYKAGLKEDDIAFMKEQALLKPALENFDINLFSDRIVLDQEIDHNKVYKFSNFAKSKDGKAVVFVKTSYSRDFPRNSYTTLYIYKIQFGKWVNSHAKTIF